MKKMKKRISFGREKLIANFLLNLKYKLEKVFLEFFYDAKTLYKKEIITYQSINR